LDDPWWEIFDDPQLNAYVAECLENNWDIKLAAARVLEARAQFYQARADRYPNVGGDASYDRRKTGGSRIDSGLAFETFQLGFPARYEVDLWGQFAKAAEAARSEILRQEENRRTVAQTVVAETINLYLRMEALERRIEIARRSVEAFERSLEFVSIRYRRGLVSVLDLRQARRILAGAEARIPELQQDLGLIQQNLTILLGRYPRTDNERPHPEEYYRALPDVPAGLPSELLARRPDVRASEARLVALNKQIGVAKAARFPSITLTGNFGYASSDLENLLQTNGQFWNLTGGLTQPLFNAGRLKAAQKAAEARYQQAVAEYADTVLNAFAEAEGALLARQKQLERRQRFTKFLNEARDTQRVAQNRYVRGLTTYLDVLDAQQTRFTAEENLVLVDLAILINWVDLHRALGGSWAEPEPVAETQIKPYDL
jgi:multidrug efflux system outer membrane protein